MGINGKHYINGIVVNIQTYSDFDMPTSRKIMIAPLGMNKQTAKVLVERVKSQFGRSTDVDKVVAELKTHGFTGCKSYNLTIGGEL